MSNEVALLRPRARDEIVGDLMSAGYDESAAEALVERALAAERRATVERIRAALLGPDASVDALYERHTRAILDAEAAR